MKLQNVLISTKQTAYEWYKREYDNVSEVLSPEELMTIIAAHNDHYNHLNRIRQVLEKHAIPYQRVYMPYAAQMEFQDRDLVISIGGDGTVMNTARYVTDNTPVLTLRSDERSVGALCSFDADEFEPVLQRILDDDFGIEKWTRLEGRIGNKVDLALNEIFVGPKYRPMMAKYEIEMGDGRKDVQRGSGLIVTTGAGSTGWYGNVPGSEGSFPKNMLCMKFIATELVSGEWKSGIVTDAMKVRSLASIGAVVSFDGDTEKRIHPFIRGQVVEIKVSDKPLRVIR